MSNTNFHGAHNTFVKFGYGAWLEWKSLRTHLFLGDIKKLLLNLRKKDYTTNSLKWILEIHHMGHFCSLSTCILFGGFSTWFVRKGAKGFIKPTPTSLKSRRGCFCCCLNTCYFLAKPTHRAWLIQPCKIILGEMAMYVALLTGNNTYPFNTCPA